MRVNVVIPTYNRLDYLKRALSSVILQTYKDFGLYVIDNASDDGTYEYLSSISDKRLEIVRHYTNIGFVGNLNSCLDFLDAEYLYILHDDDFLEPMYLEVMVNKMDRHPDAVFGHCGATIINESGEVIRSHLYNYRDYYDSDNFLIEWLNMKGMSIICPSVIYRSDKLRQKGLQFRESLPFSADQGFFVECSALGGIVYEGRALINYREHENALTQAISLNYMKRLHDRIVLSGILERQISLRLDSAKTVLAVDYLLSALASDIWFIRLHGKRRQVAWKAARLIKQEVPQIVVTTKFWIMILLTFLPLSFIKLYRLRKQ